MLVCKCFDYQSRTFLTTKPQLAMLQQHTNGNFLPSPRIMPANELQDRFKQAFEEIKAREKQRLGRRVTFQELSVALTEEAGLKPDTTYISRKVSDRRSGFSQEILAAAQKLYGLSPKFIRTGEGPMFISSPTGEGQVEDLSFRHVSIVMLPYITKSDTAAFIADQAIPAHTAPIVRIEGFNYDGCFILAAPDNAMGPRIQKDDQIVIQPVEVGAHFEPAVYYVVHEGRAYLRNIFGGSPKKPIQLQAADTRIPAMELAPAEIASARFYKVLQVIAVV